MNFTKRDLKLLIPFILFWLVGFTGIYSVDYITGSQSMETTLKWCGIPTLALGIYYAYRSTFGYDQYVPVWRNAIGILVMTTIISAITFVSFQGLLIRINCNVGKQKEYVLTGQIINLDYPEEKKAGNKYSISIKRTMENDTIKLDVPTNNYSLGQMFTKNMKIGSLGFIYADN